ncbi:DUF2752 domain-containing protein [Acutalibacter muris]|uniref:DUF2752 domain-containing protein n=1 Tax=Acutalibacter muris TaxID=1796620 RepID=UPI0026F3D3D6|nr:DUF2752 domain-containing protein [Acutalibacter muris]
MKRRALIAAGVLLALCLGAAAILLLRPECLILKYTGLYCAGCGTQRMVAALLRGDFRGALGQNLFMLAFLPGAGIYIVVELLRFTQGKRPLYRSKAFIPALCAALGLSLMFTVLRNLPGFQWLAPSWAGP